VAPCRVDRSVSRHGTAPQPGRRAPVLPRQLVQSEAPERRPGRVWGCCPDRHGGADPLTQQWYSGQWHLAQGHLNRGHSASRHSAQRRLRRGRRWNVGARRGVVREPRGRPAALHSQPVPVQVRVRVLALPPRSAGGHACGVQSLRSRILALERLDQLRHHLEDITDDSQVGDVEDRRLRILVDSHHGLRCLHAGQVLHGT
jgi:hypothetical protein